MNLDLSKVPRKDRTKVKKEIGDFVINETLRDLEGGKSPVKDAPYFKRLNKAYAKEEKGGNTTPNLELDGDMLDAFKSKNTKAGIEIGIFGSKQAIKADGHNTGFEGHPTLAGKGLKRQFIPTTDGKYKQRIEREIKQIIKESESKPERVKAPEIKISTDGQPTGDSADLFSISLDDIFNQTSLERFLNGEGDF